MKIYKLKNKVKGSSLLVLDINGGETITFGYHIGYPKPMNGLYHDSNWNLSFNDKDVGFHRVKDDVLIKGCQYISGKLGDLKKYLTDSGFLMRSLLKFDNDITFLGIISEHKGNERVSIIFNMGKIMYSLDENSDLLFHEGIKSRYSVKKLCEDLYNFEVHTDLKIKNRKNEKKEESHPNGMTFTPIYGNNTFEPIYPQYNDIQ